MADTPETAHATETTGPTRTATAEAFGAAVRARRRALRLTQERLAELAGLSQKHVARLERAERLPTVHAVLLVAQALGVSAGELVREVEVAVGSGPKAA